MRIVSYCLCIREHAVGVQFAVIHVCDHRDYHVLITVYIARPPTQPATAPLRAAPRTFSHHRTRTVIRGVMFFCKALFDIKLAIVIVLINNT